jgi:very-short-patch-repair endonuclease
MVIEIDGSQHNETNAVEYDGIRTEILQSMGIDVLRFSNSEIDNNFNAVCEEIYRKLPLLASPISPSEKGT